jgi:hypothetical protein
MRAGTWNRLEAGLADGSRVSDVRATLRSRDRVLEVTLTDEGRDGDATAGDGVFTGLLPNPAAGSYSVVVRGRDEFGNSSETVGEEELVFTLPEPGPAAVIR